MAGLLFLKISSSISGNFPGVATHKGFENQIPLLSTQHFVEHLPATGSTRIRQSPTHGNFIISKLVDRSSPLFYNAWYRNEMISQFKVSYLKQNATGVLAVAYEVELTGARVMRVAQTLAEPSNTRLEELEEISFTYTSISFRHLDGNIEVELNNNTNRI